MRRSLVAYIPFDGEGGAGGDYLAQGCADWVSCVGAVGFGGAALTGDDAGERGRGNRCCDGVLHFGMR